MKSEGKKGRKGVTGSVSYPSVLMDIWREQGAGKCLGFASCVGRLMA